MKTLWAGFFITLCAVAGSAAPARVPRDEDKLNPLEKKLVGAWLGDSGCAGNLVFQADGTYHHVDFGPGGGMFEVGTWKLASAELPTTLALTPMPTEKTEGDAREETRYHVTKLNDKELFFRWAKFPDSTVYEHRRGTEADNVAIRIAILDHAVQRYLGNQKHGAGVNLPANLKALVDTKILPSSKSLLDPWGREFQYDVTGKKTKNKEVPDIWTETPDKKIIDNWSKRK